VKQGVIDLPIIKLISKISYLRSIPVFDIKTKRDSILMHLILQSLAVK